MSSYINSVPTQLIRITEVEYSEAVNLWINETARIYMLKESGEHVLCNGRGFKEMVDHFDNGGKFGVKDLTPQLEKYFEDSGANVVEVENNDLPF